MIDRRTFLAAAAALAGGCRGVGEVEADAQLKADRTLDARFEAIRATRGEGGRLGVAAIDTSSGRRLYFDAGSRYAMASTFKLPLAGALLALADRGEVSLTEELALGPGDPLDYSPIVEANVRRGRLSVEQLCAAIVERSDNSAANMLLRRIGGPEGLTRFMRACGDQVSRLDRYEMELNTNLPGDPRDTTSPAAMADLARALVLGEVLRPESRARLAQWLKQAVPGADRLRAGLPAAWTVGHKTGSGSNGAINDVAIVWRPAAAPLVIASYQSGGNAAPAIRAAAHASVGRLVAERFA